MKRYIKSNYTPPKGPRTQEDYENIARRISRNYDRGFYGDAITTEDIIETFCDMSPEYDDYWGRGVRTKAQEKELVSNITSILTDKYGVDDVIDNTWN